MVIAGDVGTLHPVVAKFNSSVATPPARSLAVASWQDLQRFYVAIDVLVDVAVMTSGSRFAAMEALAAGTPVCVPDSGLQASYVCSACHLYQPGRWTALIKHLQVLQAGIARKQQALSKEASRFATAMLNEERILPVALSIMQRLQ